jgi:hypothetical protein
VRGPQAHGGAAMYEPVKPAWDSPPNSRTSRFRLSIPTLRQMD